MWYVDPLASGVLSPLPFSAPGPGAFRFAESQASSPALCDVGIAGRLAGNEPSSQPESPEGPGIGGAGRAEGQGGSMGGRQGTGRRDSYLQLSVLLI